MLRLNNLIGFGSGGNDRPESLQFLSSSRGASGGGQDAASVTIPTTAMEGDLAVICNNSSGTDLGYPATVIPSGWTSIVTSTTNFVNLYYKSISAFKVLTASDIDSTISGMVVSSTYSSALRIGIFRAPDVIKSASIQGTPNGQEIYNASAGSLSQTIVSGTSPSIVIGFGTQDVITISSGTQVTGLAPDLNYRLDELSSPSATFSGSFSAYFGTLHSYRIGYTV